MDDYQTSPYAEFVDKAYSVMSSYKITDEEILNLEEATQLQSSVNYGAFIEQVG